MFAACLVIGLAATPAAVAAPGDAKAKPAQKSRTTTESLRKRIVEAEEDLRGTGRGIRWLSDLAKRNENGIKFLTAAAPQLVNGLTSLRDASLQLKGGLETLAAAYTSVEYGAVRLWQRPGAGGDWEEVPGAKITSSDIPDDGNTATVSASLPFQATGATQIKITGIIRTNEVEPGASHGEMGGILYAKCIQAPSCGGFIPPGSLACTPVGPPDEREFSIPDGDTTEQTLIPVTGAASRTDSERPNENDKSPTGDDDDVCTLPFAGVYELTAAVTFSDIPDTRTPSPRE